MADIPTAALSDHLHQLMSGKALVSAVFFTYQFEPGFFEAEVLPVLFDSPFSHVRPIKLAQLAVELSKLDGRIAVFYDAGGLLSGNGAAKLDFERVPVRHSPGVFHPKNVFLLVEEKEVKDGIRARSLIVTSLSANLTESGWWENVEAFHTEVIPAGARFRMHEDLVGFLRLMRGRTRQVRKGMTGKRSALQDILDFLGTTEGRKKRIVDGQLQTRFYAGGVSVTEFLRDATDQNLKGLYLEVLSPFLDIADSCAPLQELIEAFKPKETRVFLPMGDAGEALCKDRLYDHITKELGAAWGALPKEVTRRGAKAALKDRFMHAKVYRFFSQNPKREVWFIGSANLTTAAHTGVNVETGFLVETRPERRPEFWLQVRKEKPRFATELKEKSGATAHRSSLSLLYNWDDRKAEALWDAKETSPTLRLESKGIHLGDSPPLPSREWVPLADALAERLAAALEDSSLVTVIGEKAEPLEILVQEEGMFRKPSLLLKLSPEDILRFWSLLTPEQRSELIATLALLQGIKGMGDELMPARLKPIMSETLFGTFAGIFHGFAGLERGVREALERGREKDADYRLFGTAYDSLGHLLDLLVKNEAGTDPVNRYIMALCARQVCREIGKSFPDYWSARRSNVEDLEGGFAVLEGLRREIAGLGGEDMEGFLDWFEKWFLRKAEPLAEAQA